MTALLYKRFTTTPCFIVDIDKNYFWARLTSALTALVAFATVTSTAQPAGDLAFRPPAVPLVTFDPYLSIWSEADHLTDDVTRHWTRHEHPLAALIRIDGVAYRLMGNAPKDVPALPQTGLKVTPTRSIYEFDNGKVHVTFSFACGALPDDLEVFSRPVNYLTWNIRSVDGASHHVELLDTTSALISVNRPNEKVDWKRRTSGPLTVLRAGTVSQPILGSAGDDHRVNWGYVYAAASTSESRAAIGAESKLLAGFASSGRLPETDDSRLPRAANDESPTLAFAFDLGNVATQPVTRQVLVAYDEIYAIKYFGKRLRPYWRREGATAESMLEKSAREYTAIARRCEAFDRELMADAAKAGGDQYAQMIALAYRECLAACGLAVDKNGQPLFFTKENTSNGDIATVDVFYPMDPVLLFLSPSLAKASVVPILSYAASWHWKFPNAPHDLGTYPIARGTDDGGEGMPVEESGNMLLLCDAIAQIDGNARFVAPWWNKLTEWADYLERYGLDPENQLCTDDFMGHLAHNANLSVKAILGLAAYGDLCQMRGDTVRAEHFRHVAKVDAEHWIKVAGEGDHYRLAFDKPNTWSQKYNLVWDHILGLNIFPPEVARTEVAYYKKVMQRYGVPLDSRTHLTKTDWSFWSATLAANQSDFRAILAPIYDYLNTTTARSPLADSYVTDDIHSDGMHARPVVGGLFIKMLDDHELWMKWARRDHTKVGGWASLPGPEHTRAVVPTGQKELVTWQYTTQKPADGWTRPEFDSSRWSEGQAGFGTDGTPGAVVRTKWDTGDIWIRRDFVMPSGHFNNLKLSVYHDEDVEIYFNGVLAASEEGYTTGYTQLEISSEAKALLKTGARITVAAHCHQTTGGQDIDIGLIEGENE